MKAMVYTRYGSPEVLGLEEIPKPIPKDDEVLVKVHAVSVNGSDCEFLTATPAYVRLWGPLKPKYNILGSDIAGRVEAAGSNVKLFQPGDAVFGDIMGFWGGFAEYVCAPENRLMLKPASMTFEQASTLPQAGVVALQGLRDKGRIQPGQKVLINGAGGGSGTFAVQIAKSYGAEVSAVDNNGKLELMRSIGADQVFDYAREDFTRNRQAYDLILDFVASRSIFDYRRALSAGGTYVLVGGSLPRILEVLLLGPLVSTAGSKKLGILGWKTNTSDLVSLQALFEAGKVVPVIDRCYPLTEVAEALSCLGQGQARGKLVITIETDNNT